MDVAQVSHLYRPSIGGIENYVYRLNESARAAGHDVTTYTTDLSLANDASPLSTGEDVHYCETDFDILRNPLSVGLHRRLRRSSHDLYHLHNPWFLPTLEAAHAIPEDASVVQTVHSAQITSNNALVRALNVGYKPLAQYIFDRVDHNFVQGATEKQRLLDRFDIASDDVSVVPNGIHPDAYDVPDADVRAFQEAYDLDPDVPTVLYVSRLIPEKNPDVFVEAVSEHLPDRDLQAVLVGTGEPEFVESVRAMADDRVRFLSNLEFEELKASYHAADLFTFLGTWEGLPTVILEAMNARLPIISTPVGAIPDAVVDGEHGTIVSSPPDARGVATAIRYYLDLPGVRAEVGERNRARVRTEYGWDGVAADILETYGSVVLD
jgi:glycosyltransferase involved in cell wall biosynthesis